MAFIHMSLYSRCLQRTVPVNCVVPMDSVQYLGQDLPEEKPFRTLYLLNGFFGNNNDWTLAGDIARLAIEHNIAFICPAGENKFYIDNEFGEYHGRFIGEELVEMTRRLFPLSRERKDTYIGGLSMGGYGALRNGLKYNDVFSRIVALSPGIFTTEVLKGMSGNPEDVAFFGADALFLNKQFLKLSFGDLDAVDGSDKDPYALYDAAAASAAGCPDIYLAIGMEDPLYPNVKSYADYLEKRGAPLMRTEDHGIHDFDYWNIHLKDALERFLK